MKEIIQKTVKEHKAAKIIAFIGKPASQLEKIADICFCADTPQTSTAQEVHILAYHIICDLIEIKYVESTL
jgi:DNA-binding MurR/RpiR family transcriptional regulator